MMLSKSSEYALRALIYLTRKQGDWPIPGRDIAREAGIPEKYLSKILGDLARAGVLEANRGKSGGFRLARAAEAIRLQDVLSPFERFDRRRCPFGNEECSDEEPCLAHDAWKRVIETFQKFLQTTSVADVSIKSRHKKKRKPRMKSCVPLTVLKRE